MDYEVKLEVFEGPLDLLLHLIYKNEVDIFDIPIATITDQYLEYIDMMESLNINMAGDFLIMASTLIHIKSKLLLPNSEGQEEEDPRVEITVPLLEYMRVKEIAEELSEREILDRDVFARHISSHIKDQAEEENIQMDVNLFQLIDAFKRIVEQRSEGVPIKIQTNGLSVKERIELIIAQLRQKGAIFFREIFDKEMTVKELIITFLAMLELVHTGFIKVFQPTPTSDIRLMPCIDKNGGNGGEQKT
jgi:segregation and condensation protein A